MLPKTDVTYAETWESIQDDAFCAETEFSMLDSYDLRKWEG